MGYTKNIGHNLLSQALKISLGVVTGILVARALGPHGQGYVAYILLIFNLLGTFGHFGIVNAVTFFQKKSGFERSAIYNSNLNTLLIIAGALAAGLLYLRAGELLLRDYNFYYIAGGIILMVSTLLTSHHQGWLTGDEKIIKSNNIGLIAFFLKSIVIIGLWSFGWLTPASFFGLSVGAMLLWFIILQCTMQEIYLPLISKRILKAEFRYGSVAWLAALFAFLHYRADQVMIKQILGVAELGVYSVAVMIAELMFLLPLSINTALTGRLYNLQTGDDGRLLLARTLRISFYLSAILMGVGLLGSLLIPYLYGRAFGAAVSVTMILLPGVLFACIPKVASPWFFSSGRPRVHLIITFITLLLNILLNLLFIPRLGINGAALASSISYFVYGVYYILLLHLREGFSLSALFRLDSSDLRLLKNLVKR